MRIEQPAYSILVDPERKYVELSLRGSWNAEVTTEFNRQFLEALLTLPANGCPFGEQVALIDLTEFAVQPRDILPLLGELANDPAVAPRRAATVVGSMLLQFQARRVAPNHRLFSDRPSAVKWLHQ
ncbi:hypothetical protein AX777_20640 [Sphingobium yanoikuyae]|uniref:STAS/SEC14 domain-containing protein n=1 Tax=Sphingobium yanoikuyae TaxID=13690 RepID=A0A177JTX1_SPHYA|nr:hypothetical protein [Sphingobium yanoikuyae]OAH44679.1 hypothetical protein AX777_20640 [Sphingobium yanoikuyae]